MTWPCHCTYCMPADWCDVCGVAPDQMCKHDCSEHPNNRAPCPAMIDAALRSASVPQPEDEVTL